MKGETVREDFGRRLRELRQRSGWSQKELAERMSDAGFSWRQTTAAKTEAAERPVPVEEATALATLFSVSVDSLVHPMLRNPLAERLDSEFRIYHAAEREAQAKLQDHQDAQKLSEFAQARIRALRTLETYLDGDVESFKPAIREIVRQFFGGADWIDILGDIGFDREMLTRLDREVTREVRTSEVEDPLQARADLFAERLTPPNVDDPEGTNGEH